MRKGVIATKTL